MESRSSPRKNSNSKRSIIATVVIVVVIASICCYFIFKPKQYNTFEDLVVLSYGDTCNREAETLRANLPLTMDNVFLKNQVNLVNSAATPLIEMGFTERGVELCNPYELLVCNATTGKCDCGDYSLTSIFGERYAPKMIVSERGGSLRKKNNKICRWAQGTYCVPNNVTNSFDQNIRFDFGCTDGSSCKVKGSGKPCTMETFETYIAENEREKFTTDLYTGKICTCQSDNYYFRVLEVLT